jgi:hypothetical protein
MARGMFHVKHSLQPWFGTWLIRDRRRSNMTALLETAVRTDLLNYD